MSAPKITRLETAAIRAVGPSVLVRVWAGDEYGLGECYPSAPAAGIHQIVVNLEEQLLGEDPRDVEKIYEKMRRWNLFTGGQAGAVLDYIPFAPHNVSSPVGTIAAAHVCAAVSNFAVLEWHAIDMPHWADFVRYSGGEIIKEGHIELTEAPGLGLELDEEVAYAHRHSKGGIPFFGRE